MKFPVHCTFLDKVLFIFPIYTKNIKHAYNEVSGTGDFTSL